METDGYLFLRDFIDRGMIPSVRRAILEEVFGGGRGSDQTPKCVKNRFKDVRNSGRFPEVRNFIQKAPMLDFFSALLGGNAMAFDYVWSRVVGPGECEAPHCDSIYMNRGTKELYTAWVPLVDVPLKYGAIMLLENSHRMSQLNPYRSLDIDIHRGRRSLVLKHGRLFRGFSYSKNPMRVQWEFRRRWLSTDFCVGDVLLFSVHVMHCTLDNRSENYRVTLDARFQLDSQPFDDRFMGERPIGHTRSRLTPLRSLVGLGRIGG